MSVYDHFDDTNEQPLPAVTPPAQPVTQEVAPPPAPPSVAQPKQKPLTQLQKLAVVLMARESFRRNQE